MGRMNDLLIRLLQRKRDEKHVTQGRSGEEPECCGNCLHWQYDSEDNSGTCHRYAPPVQMVTAAVVRLPLVADWPRTEAIMWCGEWKDVG